LQVFVRDNNVDQALRALKKKMQREGIFREMKRRDGSRFLSIKARHVTCFVEHRWLAVEAPYTL